MARLLTGLLVGLVLAGALNMAVVPVTVQYWPTMARPAVIVTLLLSMCAGVILAQRKSS